MNEMNMTKQQLGTILIFAARYAHNRNTGAALAVCRAIENEWRYITRETQEQLQRESYEATCNIEDWEIIRKLPLTQIGKYCQARFKSAEGGNSETGATMP